MRLYRPAHANLVGDFVTSHRDERADVQEGAGMRAIPPEDVERWALAYLQHAPISLALRELNRLLAVESLYAEDGAGPRTPVLDVGCGDGFWWTVRKRQRAGVYGIDISLSEVAQSDRHIHAECCDISAERPFPDIEFAEMIGNCSLEHVRDIDAALRNMRVAAAEGCRLILFVPTPQWGYEGLILSFLLRRFPRLAMTVSGAMNGFFQHWHLYEVPIWQSILAQNGWKVRASYGLGNHRSELLFRLFLPAGFVEFLFKSLFRVYPSKALRWAPRWTLRPMVRLLTWALADPVIPADSAKAYEYLIIAEAAPHGKDTR